MGTIAKTTTTLTLAAALFGGFAPPNLHADDSDTLRAQEIVPASIDEVWAAFTSTSGVEAWMVPVAEVDFRIGGTLKTNYDRAAGIGGPGTIVHHILAYEPRRMIAMRFDAPENAAVAKIAEATWWLVRLDPIDLTRTRVTISHCGFGAGPEWEQARTHFARGNAWTLQQLKKHFEALRQHERTLRREVVVAAPIERAWAACSTTEGLRAWFGAVTAIDLKPGGFIEAAADPSSAAQVPSTAALRHRVLMHEHHRVLAFDARVPADLPGIDNRDSLWSVLRLEPRADGGTRIALATLGWGADAAWEAAYRHFERENQAALERLRKHLENAPNAAAAAAHDAFALAEQLIGGEWIAEDLRPDGVVFRVRNVYEHGPGGRSIVARGWLGDADGMFFHGATQLYRDPTTGETRFQNIDERGAIAAGDVQVDSDRALVWQWNVRSPSGADARFRVVTTLESDDLYHLTITQLRAESNAAIAADAANGPTTTPMVDVLLRRVAEAPETHTRLKAAAR